MAAAVFLDTTIQVLRAIGSSDVKAGIATQLKNHDLTVTSLVVRQEWKRRLLGDVRYVLDTLEKHQGNVEKAIRHINQKLSAPYSRRKLSICLDVIASGFFRSRKLPDPDERFRLYLSAMLEGGGLGWFDRAIGHVITKSDCGCGKSDRLGPRKCSSVADCKIDRFFASNDQCAKAILGHLATSAGKSKELLRAEQMLQEWCEGTSIPSSANPCLTVGDLIIALESHGVPVFYTANTKESQHLCRPLSQTLIAHRRDKEDEVFNPAADWPSM